MLSYKDYCNLKVLVARMEDYSAIRPNGRFTLNKAMGLNAIATFATYFIVLLQFKTSE